MSDERWHQLRTIFVGIAGVLAVGVLDWVTGYEIRIFPLYFLPVAYVARTQWRDAVVVIALLSAASSEQAVHALERVRTRIMEAMERRGWPARASVGAAAYDVAPPDVTAPLKAADALMYRAKSAGKNRIHIEVMTTS